MIPIEAIYLRGSGESAEPADTREKIERGVVVLNNAFERSGAQFFLRSFKSVSAPLLATIQFESALEVKFDWVSSTGTSIRDDIINIWGYNFWPNRPPGNQFYRWDWLNLSVLAKGREDTQYLFVSKNSNASYGSRNGRYIYMHYNDINTGNELIAHEMGHSFRLEHPWNFGKTNPRTGLPTTPASYWDLAYCTGGQQIPGGPIKPNYYFSSKADAESGCPAGYSTASQRLMLDNNATNCVGTGDNLQCTISGLSGYSETLSHTHPAMLRGVAFSSGNGSGGLNQGANRMGYWGASNQTAFSFSNSQVEIMRDALRYDYRVNLGDVYNGQSNNPYIGKPRLGAASQARPPAYALDVNGDGARDLVVWDIDPFASYTTNSASFTVAYADNFTVRETRFFGRPGDIPVMADYTGDGRADQAVYRPDESGTGNPNGQGIWYWCPTTSTGLGNCSSGGYTSRAFGASGDIPLPGLKLGSVPYLAVYRPSTATFYWGPASNPYPYSQMQVVWDTPGAAHHLLLDDYDGDGLTDFGLQRASDGRVSIVLSSQGWSSGSRREFSFPSWAGYAVPDPDPGGALNAERSGALPLLGVRRTSSTSAGEQSGLLVWTQGPQTGCLFPDVPSAPATTFLTCVQNSSTTGYQLSFGSPGDTLLGGLKNPNTGGLARIAWLHYSPSSSPTLERVDRTISSASNLPSRTLTGVSSRGTAAFVSQLGTGTFKGPGPDLIVQDPNEARWVIFWSLTDYTTSTAVELGTARSRLQ